AEEVGVLEHHDKLRVVHLEHHSRDLSDVRAVTVDAADLRVDALSQHLLLLLKRFQSEWDGEAAGMGPKLRQQRTGCTSSAAAWVQWGRGHGRSGVRERLQLHSSGSASTAGHSLSSHVRGLAHISECSSGGPLLLGDGLGGFLRLLEADESESLRTTVLVAHDLARDPSSCFSCISSTAFSACSGSSKATNPNPLALPSESFMMAQLVTCKHSD
ncbi:hypothetical protein PMAYCL1PPCAC_00334, partial [Pristionchus mayeri]